MFNINPSVESQHYYFIVCRNLNYPLLNYSQSVPIYLSFITEKKKIPVIEITELKS